MTSGQRLGADATKEDVARVGELMESLAALNPTPNPAASPSLCGEWEIVWTTESELLGLTANGFFGLECTRAYQTISREKSGGGGGASGSAWAYSLANSIDFEQECYLNVGSTCEPAGSGGRVSFAFESCAAKWKGLTVPLPPVGSGYFEVLYLDDELRLCKDSRGDLQICQRR